MDHQPVKSKAPLKEKIKRSFREETDKLKQMTFKEKIWYIWEYYKVHIFIIVLVIAFSVSMGKAIYHNMKYESVFHCAVVNNMLNQREENYLIDGFGSYIGMDSKHETITYDSSYYFIWDNSAYSNTNYSSRLKVAAALGAKTLDAFLADKTYIDSATPEGQLYDLSEILPEELFEAVKDYLYYSNDSEGVSRPFAVDLSSTHLVKERILYQTPPLYGIVSNSEHVDIAIEFIKYAFELEK